MDRSVWFNLWVNKLWPYSELQPGDELYWYESSSKKAVWRTRVMQVEAFQYSDLDSALDALDRAFGCTIDRSQPYLDGKPSTGYCLGYRVDAEELLDIPKPAGLRFNRRGWERGGHDAIKEWLGI